ncbi:hypothetical protein NHX12_019655 [Muraenolepis orangiensis]|uniref:Uncharacterized protein n=1 Tax=Muraenolepis orangiensis TaxID=630683 RepID=A0A9Q0IXN6_9TELE|nr:hypothetical protein NHX12_019655 [Muraenolepis orangiensis]
MSWHVTLKGLKAAVRSRTRRLICGRQAWLVPPPPPPAARGGTSQACVRNETASALGMRRRGHWEWKLRVSLHNPLLPHLSIGPTTIMKEELRGVKD